METNEVSIANEEAILAIKKNMPTKGTYIVLTEALYMAIEALEKQIAKGEGK